MKKPVKRYKRQVPQKITVWDFYAGMALLGLLSDPDVVMRDYSEYAQSASNMADFMMLERPKK